MLFRNINHLSLTHFSRLYLIKKTVFVTVAVVSVENQIKYTTSKRFLSSLMKMGDYVYPAVRRDTTIVENFHGVQVKL